MITRDINSNGINASVSVIHAPSEGEKKRGLIRQWWEKLQTLLAFYLIIYYIMRRLHLAWGRDEKNQDNKKD